MYEDKTLICKDCHKEFVFTAGEQEFYEAVCDDCGGVARVPFKPSEDKPVYCSACFEKRKNNA